ncbi:hypothetical protein A6A06_16555 [Streptomyces sp. CB02923]|uniref:hypothetical protein n=1 Tax=Streptomyces sp. CB02923 TaxID=1718985 RepID=UPI00093E03CC|nr:hypothetical protein [Streptomyces sp. CB02923]OKI02617.1 hypothetical protein A6A06_16555 [Streptomyces sp. CB02923]
MKKIVPLAIAVSALALVAGGFLLFAVIDAMKPGTAERGDVIGSWTGSGGARLTLREDGTATGVKVPARFAPDGTPTDTLGGSGTWSMKKKMSSAADQEIEVVLHTSPGIRAGVDFSVNGEGAEDGLYLPVSAETAQQFRFKKIS